MCLNVFDLIIQRKSVSQVQSTTMGSPVSVVAVNLVTEFVDKRALSTFHSSPGLESATS